MAGPVTQPCLEFIAQVSAPSREEKKLSTALSILVLAIGVIALVIASGTKDEKFGSSSKKDNKNKSSNRKRGGRADSTLASTGKKRTEKALVLGEVGEGDECLIQSQLRIPPPEEKRIEAVAPKNDGHEIKRFGKVVA